MKKLFLTLIVLISCLSYAQTTSVVATITDSSGQAWVGGSYKIDLVTPHSGTYTLNGNAFTQHIPITALNGSGALSVTLADNTIIRPLGTQWKFTICPNATSACGSVAVSVSGASVNLSSTLSAAIPLPKVTAAPTFSKAYKEDEVTTLTGTPNSQAAAFYDTTVGCVKIYSGSSWSCLGGGTGSMTWPTAAGVTACTGTPCTAWTTSYEVGTNPNDLVQLNSSGQLPAVSGALLTGLPSGMVWPATPGIPICTGTPCTAYGTSLSETDGDIIYGASGAWTKGTSLPNGVTVTTQSLGDNTAKAASDAFVLANIASSAYPGVFTNTQMNIDQTVNTNGINFLQEFQTGQGGYPNSSYYGTDSLSVGLSVPNTSTVYQSDAIAAYSNTASTTTYSVAGYFFNHALADNVNVWGINPAALDSGHTANYIGAEEANCNISHNPNQTNWGCVSITGILGLNLSTYSAMIVTLPPAVVGTGSWKYGYRVTDGAAQIGTQIGSLTTSAHSQSQPFNFISRNASNQLVTSSLYADENSILHTPSILVQEVTASTTIASYGFGTIESPLSAGGSFTNVGVGTVNVLSAGVAQAGATTSLGQYLWTATTWPNDQCSVGIVSALGSGSDYIMFIRSNLTPAPNNTTYQVNIFPTGISVYKVIVGAATQIGSTSTITFTPGDTFAFCIVGNVITVLQNNVVKYTDSNNDIASGYPGFGLYASGSTTAVETTSWSGTAPTLVQGGVAGGTFTSTQQNQALASSWGGSCAMSTGTTCSVTLKTNYAVPLCIATEQGSGAIAGSCSVSGTVATVTAASSNSATWAVMVFGNPN